MRNWTQVNPRLWVNLGEYNKVLAKILETTPPLWALWIGKTYYGEFLTLEDAKAYQTSGERRVVQGGTTLDSNWLPWG